VQGDEKEVNSSIGLPCDQIQDVNAPGNTSDYRGPAGVAGLGLGPGLRLGLEPGLGGPSLIGFTFK
jgi:hypothetical protein